MTSDDHAAADPVSVEAIMAAVRERVAEKKARGLYTVDELYVEASSPGDPWNAEQFAAVQQAGVIRQQLVVAPSEKPLIGRVVTAVKRFVVRANAHNVGHIVHQTTRFNGEIVGYAGALGNEVRTLRADLDGVRGRLDGDTRIQELAERLERLERSALDARLARIEAGGAPAPRPEVGAPRSAPAASALDPLRLRAGLPRSFGETAALLEGHSSVLVLGADDGSVLDHLGPGALGVEADGDAVMVARAATRNVIHAEPVAYLGSLGPASQSAVLVDDLVERLDADGLARLVACLGVAVAPDGVAVVAVRNPRSSAEMTESFWRDPRRVRPVDPGTMQSLLEGAGFRSVALHWCELAALGQATAGLGTDQVARSCAVVARR
ncbi:MAG: hypothetical protein HYX33_01550 [Actinobacteria bacterium]|nr:hypothetical protein [Actinomycetota bacterium]